MNIAAALRTPSRGDFLALACALLASDGLACALPVELRRMLLDAAAAEYRVVPALVDLMKHVPRDWSRGTYMHSMLLDLGSLFPLIAPGHKWSSPAVYRRMGQPAVQSNTNPPHVSHTRIYKDRSCSDDQVDHVTVVFYFEKSGDHSLEVTADRLYDGQWVTYTAENARAGHLHLAFEAVTFLVNNIAPMLVAMTVFKHGL